MATANHPLSIFRREFLSRTVDSLSPCEVLTVSSEATQFDAVELMCKERKGCVLVVDAAKKIVGIVTERDVLNKWGDGSIDRRSSVAGLMSRDPQVLKHNASIARAVHLMAEGGYRHVPVLYGAGKDPRIISSKDFVDTIHRRLTSKLLDPDNHMSFDNNLVDMFFDATIDVLNPDPPLILSSSKSAADAVEMIRRNRKGAVVMVDHNHLISGIFTERDYLTKVALAEGGADQAVIVGKMTANPRTLPTTASIAVAFGLLSEGGYRHIPLVSSTEKLVGILSVRHFLSYLSASILATLEAEKK